MTTNGTSQPDMSKDEVGWLFVQQYYTTLSKTPSRLHLFYSKKSQFVSGNEAEIAAVSIGRQDIQERIAKLGFEDCKVRVSNVDTQASLDQIVIQVIGELSNKSKDSRKFVQTFILAVQPSGYFVLNDIFRYIKDEDDEEEETEAAAPAEKEAAVATPEEPKAEEKEAVEAEAAKPELDAAVIDQKLEEAVKEAPAPAAAPAVPAVAVPAVAIPAVAVPEPAAPKAAEPVAAAASPAPEPAKVAEEVAKEAETKVEEPKEPAPTPAVAAAAAAPVAAAATVAPAAAEPEKPKGPPKPMTWASRIAAAAGPVAKPAAPAAAAPAPAAPGPKAAAAAPAAAPKAAAPSSAAPKVETAAAASKEGSEWQTAGNDSKRQNRPQSTAAVPQDKDSALGYIKYVTEKVDEATLRAHLEKYGQVVYFDINRAKNCAFIEFGSPAGYQAAVAANPHTINGESIHVEARRPKAGAYGSSNHTNPRGNAPTRGRGGFEGRNGSLNGGRGGFTGQNRGRGGAGAGGAPRGRGGAQNLAA